MLRLDFVTLFPEMVLPALEHSMLRRAREAGLVSFAATNPRDFTTDKHRTVDEAPFGGGPGMLMKVDPILAALEALGVIPSGLGSDSVPSDPKAQRLTPNASPAAVILTDPTGTPFTQSAARELVDKERVVFLCGHYEGIDHRITNLATHIFSIGDFVLTGGELPALVMADAVVRLLPGVLGSAESLEVDSHSDGLLSAPQYTRPEEFNGWRVPDVLLSGNHKAIARWRREQSLKLTRDLRPDLLARATLEKDDLDMLSS